MDEGVSCIYTETFWFKYQTGCGHRLVTSVKPIDYEFCPFCGHRISVIKYRPKQNETDTHNDNNTD